MDGIRSSIAVSLAGVPQFLLYLAAALVLVALFLVLYSVITPQRELRLIRQGNVAAAVSLGGALLGFAIPLSKSIEQSHDIADMVIWSGVALVVQLTVFVLSGLVIAHEARKLEEGDLAAASFLAFAAVSAGLIDAACMSYTP